ncbi:hypothetical protein [Bdellovibrio bacteriovorus]|uniref:phage major capsid protein n=1 Tax=Bdellovibrio bacteriovorus TaxID=959 RepID=UPI0035A5B616
MSDVNDIPMQIRALENKKQTVSVSFVPDTWDQNNRTVDFILATDKPMDFGGFYEVLGLSPGELRTKRLDDGIVPVLDSHPQKQPKVQTIEDQHGAVIRYVIQDGMLRGTLLFAKDERSDRAFMKIGMGVLKTGSVGFIPYKYKDVSGPEDLKKTYRAIDWEVVEFSLVSIPKDPDAQARNLESEKPEPVIVNENQTLKERNQKMSDTTPNPEARTLTQADIDSAVKAREDARAKRDADIRAAVRNAGFEDSLALDLITRNVSFEDASKEILQKIAARNEESNNVKPNIDINHAAERSKSEDRVRAMETAIEHRLDSSVKVEGLARNFAGKSLSRMMEESLKLAGHDIRGMDEETMIRQAFQGTSEFAVATGSSISKRVKKGYDYVSENFKPFISETSRSDFKESAAVSLSDAPDLEPLNEHGEFQTGTFEESSEKYKVETYGKRIALTRQAIINDDLSLFDKIPFAMGVAGGRKVHELVFGILKDNAKMSSDNTALFHATHANLLGAAGANLEAVVEQLLLLLRTQKSPKKKIMGYNPGWIIVGADQEIAAKKLITAVTASKSDDVNVLANTLQGVIVEASLAAKQVILTGRKEEVDLIEVAWLKGNKGVNVRKRENPNILGVEWDVFMDVGAAPMDFRGFYRGSVA